MPGDDAFDSALEALLSGQPVEAVLGERAGTDASLEALRVLSVIGQASRAVLFGAAATSPVARRWGHLEIREEIGRGASGTVYRAWDTRLARDVALKLFDPETTAADAAIAEGRLLARLRHPNIVTVYGADAFDGVAGLWMELIEGDSLDAIVERDGPMGMEDTLLVGLDLARALSAVHAAGMLHRDVKARNVVRQRGGRLVLMDLGAGFGADQAATTSGGVGTPLYMAPEVLAGGPASVQGDIYGLGVLLYHLLTRSYPVLATDLAELKAAHRAGDRPALLRERPDLPTAARLVVERACAPDPGRRYANAQALELALMEALGVVIDQRARVVPRHVRRWRRHRRQVIATLGLVAGVVMAVSLGWNTGPGRAARRTLGMTVPPRSPLYFVVGGGLGIVDGGGLRLVASGSQHANALAVTEQHGVRAMAGWPPWMGGAWFDLDGTPRRARPAPNELCCFNDGTTDGRFNYALRQDSTLLEPIGSRPLAPPAVYRYDLEWRDGELLFELEAAPEGLASARYSGITFDGASGTFFVTRNEPGGATWVEQWSVDGRRLSTIRLRGAATAIAVDPVDHTLWLVREEGGALRIRFDNIDASGTLLGTFEAGGGLSVGVSGLEFAWPLTK